jgi:DNA-binding NtrC family response regulator
VSHLNDKMEPSAKTIMVIDDEPDLLTITTRMLENDGFKVHAFRDSEKALAHIESDGCNACSLIVTDVRMPKINGIQLAKRVKQLRPDMKIILMTAFEVHQKEWQTTLPSSEIDRFLTKPLRMSDLIEAIKKCADGDGRSSMQRSDISSL